MDTITSSPINPIVSTNTSVFGDNVQSLLNAGLINLKPTGIIVVNSIADVVGQPGVTTLRDAINKGNADPGEDLIVFDRSIFSAAQTITLNLGDLEIAHNLDIIAPKDTLTGGDLVTVSGNKTTNVFVIDGGATVNISRLTIADGSVLGGQGAGITNTGTLTLDSTIVHNGSAYQGGGIYNTGNLTVTNSTISGNVATNPFAGLGGGGGIYNDRGVSNIATVTIKNSTISGNSSAYGGGGIYNTQGSIEVDNSIISNNSATSNTTSNNFASGGGIFNVAGNVLLGNTTLTGNSGYNGGGIFDNSGTLTLDNSTLKSNLAANDGGGIDHFDGTVAVSNSTISNNSAGNNGGGINNANTGTLTVDKSTISGNSAAQNGGGIYNQNNTLTVSNSTLSSNSSGSNGGGIYNILNLNNFAAAATVSNSTIAANKAVNNGAGIYNHSNSVLTLVFSTLTLNQAANGSGIFNDAASSANVRNTIIASNRNSAKGVNPDVSGAFTSSGYNLIGKSTGSTGFGVTGDIVGTSANPINPLLGSLKSNGGPTKTIALLTGSPAINAGDPTVLPTDPTTDQRGMPRVQGGRADIGAFELS